MNEARNHELLEIYKLHAEFADRVSQRREGANRLFVSLLVGLILLPSIFVRSGLSEISVTVVSLLSGGTGLALSVSWYVVIRSYRQLNTGKFHVLQELEKELAFPFFKKEWEFLGGGQKIDRYWRLTVVETGLPIIFLVLSIALVTFGLYQMAFLTPLAAM